MGSRCPSWSLLAVALAAMFGGTNLAGAETAAGWERLADTVFRPAAERGGATGVLLPVAFAEDREGFLWEGGEGGLARWDGYRFRLYAADDARPDGLADHNVLALHTDPLGRVWVGTLTGGLWRYDGQSDRFYRVALNDGADVTQAVRGIDDDGTRGLWVATSTGLFHLDAAGRVVGTFRPTDAGADAAAGGLPLRRVVAVVRDHNGVVWAGGQGGLVRGADGNRRFLSVPLPVSAGETPDNTPEVTHLLEDARGRIWVGTRGQGAYVIGAGRAPAARVAATVPPPGEAPAPQILAMVETTPGTIWLSTGGRGILEAAGPDLPMRSIHHDPFVPGSLAKNSVSGLFRDRSGLIWVGTVQGLSRYDPANDAVLTLIGDPGRRTGLRVSDASAVLARPDGSLWVGSEDNGVEILGPDGQHAAALALPLVYGMAAAPGGEVYIATRGGLYRADPTGASVTRMDVPGRPADATVNAMLVIDDTLWLGGDDGLWELRVGRNAVPAVVRHLTQPDLTDDMVDTLALAADGRIAAGTDKGFNLVDRAAGAVERVLPDASDPEALSPGSVMSFAVDRQRRLWVGTDEAGIDVLVARDAAGRARFRHIGRGEGLPDLDINRMLIDAGGRIWASTDRGLAVIDPVDLSARALQAPQGVMISSYWSNSGDRTAWGDLVFGGAGGVTIVRPDQVAGWRFHPPVAVTDLKVGGRAAWPAAAVVEVPPDGNSLAVEFSALDYSAPEQNRYEYRLLGFDRDWVETDAEHRVAAYTNLPPGEYKLLLRGSNREGVWSQPATELRVRVLPAWFETPWFRLAAAAAACLSVVGLVQARTVILRQRQHELERQVAQRTAELRASQQELQQFAYLDPLTALPNRRAFNEEFEAMTQAMPGALAQRAFGLVLVDLDGFKKVNDQFGHQAGDALLVSAAGRMRHAVRAGDFIARLGGDEFAILVRDIDGRDAVAAVCERIVSGMAAPMAILGTSITIGASVGAAMFPQDGEQPDDLYRHVDLALYEAKRTGRGAWCWYRASATAS